MALSLQAIIDSLQARIGRPITLNDHQLNLVAYSAHEGPVDAVRLSSILRRDGPDAVKRWILEEGIVESETAIRVPAHEEFGLTERVCVPIRRTGQHLGNIWIMEAGSPLTLKELQIAREAAESCVEGMRLRAASARRLVGEQELGEDLLNGGAAARASACGELLNRGQFAVEDRPSVVILEFLDAPVRTTDTDDCAAIRRVRKDVSHAVSSYAFIWTGWPRQLICILNGVPSREAIGAVESAIMRLHAEFSVSVVVGIGAAVESLDRVRDSLAQADFAVRVARMADDKPAVMDWRSLRVFRLFFRKSERELRQIVSDSGLGVLLVPDAVHLVETLETYFDFAGNAKTVAERLDIHRTTLYTRLARIEDLLGFSLRIGAVRTELHVAIKAARLLASAPPATEKP